MVGRNVTKYSELTDLDEVSQLGPESLHLSTSTTDPAPLSDSSTVTGSFNADTSSLTGINLIVALVFDLFLQFLKNL